MRTFRRNDALQWGLCGWRWGEAVWVSLSCLAVTGAFLADGDSLLSFLSSFFGILAVSLMIKGKLLAYVVGFVQCALYALFAFRAGLYGETMLNVLYYMPMQAFGFWCWLRNMNSAEGEVDKRRLPLRLWLATLVGTALGTLLYGFLLAALGDRQPWVDSLTTVGSVVGMWLMACRYVENWWVWAVVDGVSVGMWLTAWQASGEGLATVAMWCIFTLNAFYGLVRWELEMRQ